MIGSRRSTMAAMALGVALLAGCGSGGSATTTSSGSSVTTTDTTATTATTASTTTSSSSATSPSSTTLPGQPYTIGPAAGVPMAVVGVAAGDVLNLRSGPDPSAPVVATAAPLSTSPVILSGGEGRLLTGGGAWWKVTVDGTTAWANARYLAALSEPVDDLASLRTRLPSTTAPSPDALATAITALHTGGDNPPSLVVVAPSANGAITFDVIGIGDDAVLGERWAITTAPQSGGVMLTGATRTDLCSRGVSGGRCL